MTSITLFNGTTQIAGGGSKTLGLANATTDPTSTPSGGGILWERNDGTGLAHYGSGGFVCDLAPSGTGSKNTQAMVERERKFVASSSSTVAAAAGSINLNAFRGKQISIQLFQQSRDVTTPSTANMGSVVTQILVANVAGVVSVVGSSTVLGSPLGATLAAVTFDVSVTDVLTFKIANAAGGTSTDTWDWTLHALLDAN